jgi:hypothetical protein
MNVCSKTVIKHLSCYCARHILLVSLFKIPRSICKFTNELQRESVSKQMKRTETSVRTVAVMKPVSESKSANYYRVSGQFFKMVV